MQPKKAGTISLMLSQEWSYILAVTFLREWKKRTLRLVVFWCFCFQENLLVLTKINQSDCRKQFHDGGPVHIETISLICSANQCTGFYVIGTSAMKVKDVQKREAFIAFLRHYKRSFPIMFSYIAKYWQNVWT